ncbi:hypothetical protein [Vibrio metoecus]|uniref:hypothetical protein n=1 Tax=Vibrio metoecus TaxID=1481663 RepID=UPI0006D84288|nr:hypothetical protein [Vibrio metoecus]KQB08733.1 hypothetical protein XV94_14310 [Vibrio metoecus]
MVRRKLAVMGLSMVSLGAWSTPVCEVTIHQLQDVDRGYQVVEKEGSTTLLANPPLRCAEITLTLSQRQEKVAVWLTKRLKATFINGREVQASQLSFRKEEVKAGYITFDANQAKSAYVCFDESSAPISSIECEWN